MTLARLMVLLMLDSSGFRAGLAAATAQLRAFESMMGRVSAGAALTNAGRALTVGLTVPLLTGLVTAGKLSSDLNTELARTQSIMQDASISQGFQDNPYDASLTRIRDYRNELQALSIVTARPTDELAGGFYEVVSAVGETANAYEILEIAARSAVAGQGSVVDSAKNLILLSRALGKANDTDYIQTLADMALKTVQVGTVTEQELGPALSKVAGLSKAYGVSIEEVFAVMSSMAGVTGSASQVATQFSSALRSVISPSTEMKKVLKELNMSGVDLVSKHGLVGAFEQIVTQADKMGIDLSNVIGRIEGLRFVQTMFRGDEENAAVIETYRQHLDGLANSAGSVDTAFVNTTQGINKSTFEMQQALQKLRVAGEDMGEALAPEMSRLAGYVSDLAGAFSDLDEPTRRSYINFALIASAIGPAIWGIGLLWRMATSLWGGLTLLWGGLKLVSGILIPVSGSLLRLVPILGWIMLAVTLLGLAWNTNFLGIQERTAAFVARWQQSAGAISEAWGKVKAAFSNADGATSIAGWIHNVMSALYELGGVLTGTFIESVMAFFGTTTAQLLANMGAMWNNGVAALKGYASSAWQGLVAIWNNGVAKIKTQASELWNSIGSGAKGAFMLALTSVASFGMTIYAGLMTAVLSARTAMVNFGTALKTGITTGINNALASIRAMGTSMAGAFSSAITAAKNAATSIANAFLRNWTSIGGSIASGVASGIRGGIGAVVSAAQSMATAAYNSAMSLLKAKSPSRLFMEVGSYVPAGMAIGINNGQGAVHNAIYGMLDTANRLAGGSYGVSVAGVGGGGIVVEITNNFYGNPTDETVKKVESANRDSISQALQRRGLV